MHSVHPLHSAFSRPRAQRAVALALWSAAVFGSVSGSAQDDIAVSVTSTLKVSEMPAVTLSVKKALARAVLELAAEGPGAPAGAVRISGGPTKAGKQLVLKLPKAKKAGEIAWSGTLAVTFADGNTGSMPLSFTTIAAQPPRVTLLDDQLDLAQHRLVVTMNADAQRIDLAITGDDGKLIANLSKDFAGAAAGTPLVLTWVPRTDAAVLSIKIVGHDTAGFFSPTLERVPWSLAIEHQEVVFASNQSSLLASEIPKLKAVLPEILRRVKRYRGLVDVQVYIMGHTDSVGNPARNQKLSEARARTIAKWFAAHHVRAPIFARGFGEEYLKIATNDEVEEIRNRRVDYVLGASKPVAGTWFKVR